MKLSDVGLARMRLRASMGQGRYSCETFNVAADPIPLAERRAIFLRP